jgi:hypothetical protein
MQEQGKLETLIEELKKYLTTTLEINKLEAVERSSTVTATMMSGLLIGIVVVLLILFISLWAGFYISAKLGDTYSGFTLVAGFYLLLTVVLFLGRKKLIENPIRDKIIRTVLNKD